MIYIAEGERSFKSEVNALSVADPFGCRIVSLYNTYDYNLPFVDFWVQFDGSEPVSLISRLETAFTLRLTEKSDLDEVSSFLRVSGAGSVICDGRYSLGLPMKLVSGPVLFSGEPFDIEEGYTAEIPTVREIYSVIEKCVSKNFAPPSYESFALDVSNKLQKNTSRAYAVYEDAPAACVMTLAESGDCAVLGALATDPSKRKMGYGRFLIKYINNILVSEGKSVFLHRAPDENIEFYNKLGFKQYGIWNEYYE